MVDAMRLPMNDRREGEQDSPPGLPAEEYLNLFRSVPTSLGLTSLPEGRYLEVNDAWVREFGRSREEVIGHTPLELGLLTQSDQIEQIGQILGDQTGVYNHVFEFLDRTGRRVPYLTSLSFVTVAGQQCVLTVAQNVAAQKALEKTYAETAAMFRALFEASRDAIGVSRGGIHEYVNPAYLELFGIADPSELVGRPLTDFIAPDSRGQVLEFALRRGRGEQAPTFYTTRGLRRGGTEFDMEIQASVYELNGARYSLGLIRDISERVRGERALRQLNRALQAIRKCNSVLVRAQDEPSLLQEICRIICDEAGYRMAWVGVAEQDDAKTVRPTAWAGAEADYLANANISWSDTERGRGPTGTAIRTGQTIYIQDFESDPRTRPWLEAARQRGYRSSIALPLKGEDGETFGALTIYSAEPNAFTPDELGLLQELAGDLAFGIRVLRARAERKQAEEALRESELRFRTFSENAMAGIYIIQDNRLTYVNAALAEIGGYSPAELLGADPLMIIHPDDRAQVGETLRRRLTDDTAPARYEFRARRKDGENRWCEVLVARIDLNGQPAILGNLLDITDRKRAEAELKTSEAQLKDAQRIAHIGSSYWDARTDTTTWSDELYRITGWDPALPGPTRAERAKLYTPESFARINAAIERGLAAGEPYDLEVEIVRRDGVRRQARARGTPVRNPAGATIGLSGTLEDITERKQAEAMTRHLAAIVEASDDAIIGSSPDGAIVSWNPGAERLYGYSASEAIGQSIALLTPPEKRAELDRILALVRRGIPSQSQETTRLTKDGRRVDVSMTISPITDSSGAVVAVSGISRDITERKQAERRAQRFNRLMNVLSRTNEMLVRGPQRQELFDQVCRIAVEHGALSMAWVGTVDETTRLIQPVASYGNVGQYLDHVHMSADHNEIGQGPTSTAIRQKQSSVCQDIENDPRMAPWREAALRMGYRSSAAFPLKLGGAVVAAFTLYASEADGFSDDELQLLEELAGDISYTLELMQKERQRQEAEFNLGERLKEMTCLAAVRRDVGRRLPVDELCQRIVQALIPAMQFPELAVPVVELDGLVYTSVASRAELDFGLHAPVVVDGRLRGQIALYYLEDRGFLLPYEQDLLDGLAADLSFYIAREQAEAALQASQQSYRLIVETAAEGILAFDRHWRITFSNEVGARLLGYSREEMLGLSIEALVFEADREGQERRKALREQGVGATREGIYRTKSGAPVWLQVSASPITEAGQFAGSFVMLTDISPRKRAEQALQESEERYRRIVETALEGIFVFDANWRLSYCNARFAEIFGYDQAEMLGRPIGDIILPDDASAHETRKARQMSGVGGTYENAYRTKNGDSVWLLISVSPIIENGKFAGSFGMATDITERKKAEQQMRDLAAIVQASTDAISVTSLEGRLMSWNRGAEQMYGYSAVEVIGQPVTLLMPPEEQASLDERLAWVRQGHPIPSHETTRIAKDGRPIDVSISFSVMRDISGTPLGFAAIDRDISERKRAELERARQAEELARLYRASASLLSDAAPSLDALAQSIVQVLTAEFGQANCNVFLLDAENGRLVRVAAAGAFSHRPRAVDLALDGPGLVALAARTGQTINEPDVLASPAYLAGWDLARSEMTIPLKIGQRVIGALDVQSPAQSAFSDDDERLMTIFSERAALALEHARLYSRMEHLLENLTALRTIDTVIAGSFDLPFTLDVLLSEAAQRLGVESVDVVILDPAGRTLRSARLPRAALLGPGLPAVREPNSLAAQVIRENRMLRIDDLRALSDAPPGIAEMIRRGFTGYVGVPLVAKGLAKGVLEVYLPEAVRLDPERQRFLELVAGQAALAIDNSQLFENLQRSNRDLVLAYDATIEGWSAALDLRDKETEATRSG